MSERILVTGATGNTGRVIVEELKKRGVPFAALAHTEKRREELARAGISTYVGDFDNPASLDRALTGFHKAYLVCTPDEKLIPRETAFIRAAQKAGVRHIVKCSAYLSEVYAETQNLRSHGVIERVLIDSGLDYTIIRPQGYMQTFTLFSWEMIEKAGVISMPGGDGKMALVDVRDVAKVAVKALTEPGHAGKIYDVTGLVAMGFSEQAAILTKTLGKRVTYMPCSEWQLKCIMSVLGVPETPAEHVVGVFKMQRENRLEKVHPTLKDLGIPYTPYEQFAADLVAGRTGGGNSFQPPDSLFVKALNASFIVTMRVRHQLHSVLSLLR